MSQPTHETGRVSGASEHNGDAGLRQALDEYVPQFEKLAREQGLDFYPVDFELVPATFMMEVAVYGLPVRMPHWSFGVRYIHQYVQHRMGHSRIFEVVFPGNPNRAYLVRDNSLAENTLVAAHVLGHADFSRHNELFARMQAQVGYDIVQQAAARAHRIEAAIEAHGRHRVERVLDAALALEQHVDVNLGLRRAPYPDKPPPTRQSAPEPGSFEHRYTTLPGELSPDPETALQDPPRHAPVPPRPERDLLWFMAQYGPDLEDWERDILQAVREESFYFYPLLACQIMNEGWASYWHARLLREAEFLPGNVYVDAIKTHSDVVRPYAGDEAIALQINPYHLGFRIWERIFDEQGSAAAFEIRAREDDFSFVRNFLDEPLAIELQLFNYSLFQRRRGADLRVRVEDRDIDLLRENILKPKFNYGAPRVEVNELGPDGSLNLVHDHATDGRGLDLERAQQVIDYIHRIWRRPVRITTVDQRGDAHAIGTR